MVKEERGNLNGEPCYHWLLDRRRVSDEKRRTWSGACYQSPPAPECNDDTGNEEEEEGKATSLMLSCRLRGSGVTLVLPRLYYLLMNEVHPCSYGGRCDK